MHVVSGHTAVQDILIHTTQQCIHVHLPTVKNRLPSLTIMPYELLILCVIISQLHYFPNSHLQLFHGSSVRDFCIGVLTLDIIACTWFSALSIHISESRQDWPGLAMHCVVRAMPAMHVVNLQPQYSITADWDMQHHAQMPCRKWPCKRCIRLVWGFTSCSLFLLVPINVILFFPQTLAIDLSPPPPPPSSFTLPPPTLSPSMPEPITLQEHPWRSPNYQKWTMVQWQSWRKVQQKPWWKGMRSKHIHS